MKHWSSDSKRKLVIWTFFSTLHIRFISYEQKQEEAKGKASKSAPGKHWSSPSKPKEFAIPQTDRKLKRSTSRYEGYTNFTPAKKVQSEFNQLVSRGALLSYNAAIRSVQNYSKEVGIRIEKQLRSLPPKNMIDSKSRNEYKN